MAHSNERIPQRIKFIKGKLPTKVNKYEPVPSFIVEGDDGIRTKGYSRNNRINHKSIPKGYRECNVKVPKGTRLYVNYFGELYYSFKKNGPRVKAETDN